MEESVSQFYTQQRPSDVNATKVVVNAGKTVIYGQTPKTVSKEHFNALACEMGVSARDLALKVVKMTASERLDLLCEFYKDRIPESGEIYEPLKAACQKMNRVDAVVTALETQKQDENREQRTCMRRKRKNIRKISSSSSEDTASQHGDSEKAQSSTVGVTTECIVASTETATLNEQLPPRTTVEEFEAFLFGKVSPKKKPPPAARSRTTAGIAELSSQQPPEEASPSKVGFVQPAITFDASKWSPAPQRSMLDIVKDLSRAKQMLETGEIPSASVSFI